jgi:hypothetical protein
MERSSSITFPTGAPSAGTTTKPQWRSALARVAALLDPPFGIDLRTLGAFRIGLALLVLADLIGRAGDLTAHYTDQGVFPLGVAQRYNNSDWTLLSPFMWADEPVGVGILFALLGLAALAMLVGYRTRFATFATWFLTASLHTRNPLILHSGDTMTRVMLFWSMFLPLGARFSVDGLAARRVAYGEPLPRRVLSFGSAGLLLQIALVYWFSAILKTAPEWRVNGTALYYALGIEQYRTPIGYHLFQMRWPLKSLTFGTMALEVFGPIIAFFPIATERLRLLIIPAFLLFHIGINVCMDIGSFPYVCLVAWIAFLPSLFWDGLARAWQRLPDSGMKGALERGRESLVVWRSRRIAKGLRRGERLPSLRLSPVGQMAAAFCIGFALLWNLRACPYVWAQSLPDCSRPIMWLTRLDQAWGMFAPYPLKDDGWFVVSAYTVGGEEIDLFRGGAPVSWQKPEWVAWMYPNERWRKYLMNLWAKDNSPYRIYYCQYMLRDWNRTHRGRDAVTSVRMYYMEKVTPPDYAPPQPKKVLICAYDDASLSGSGGVTGLTAVVRPLESNKKVR